jgi:hypothetical protein
VLSGGGLCDGPITPSGVPTKRSVSDCDLETSTMRKPWLTRVIEARKKYKGVT